MINIGLYGSVLALWALYEGSIWGVIGFHWFWNLAQFNLYGFDVTPTETLGGAVVNFAYTANVPFMTAGVVAEDSLFLTLAALAAIIYLYLLLRGRDAVDQAKVPMDAAKEVRRLLCHKRAQSPHNVLH